MHFVLLASHACNAQLASPPRPLPLLTQRSHNPNSLCQCIAHLGIYSKYIYIGLYFFRVAGQEGLSTGYDSQV